MEETTPLPPPASTLQPLSTSCWSTIVQKKPIPAPPLSSNVFSDCKSSKGISIAVVDASAIIHGDKLVGCADKFVSVREVVEEIRDPVSRQRFARLPFLVEAMEPSPDAIRKVVKFARETGDLQTLSDVDLKLIALTYMLEAQIHGTNHLRDSPPLLHVVNVKKLPEAQMPGWGDNVPNLTEWEALEQVTMEGSMDGSRILPLKDLDDNVIPSTEITDQSTNQQAEHQPFSRPRKFNFPKREIKVEGKKMVSVGVNASKGDLLDDLDNDIDDWHPAVSRSTHRRYLKRKARRESRTDADLSSALDQLTVGDNNSEVSQEEKDNITTNLIADISLDENVIGENENDFYESTSENMEVSSNTEDTSFVDDDSSLQSLMMRSLSESTVACITSDYAIQNVILQIGLRLLASGGMQIHQLQRWVLKCHACNTVTQEIGKIFCPKCGNGGTLRKVSVTVGENGILLASRKQRIILRGTKFPLPLPQGGRDAITKNLILREDQLPQKLLYPKLKKKANNKDEEFLCSDDIFSSAGEKRAPLKPPVRKAIAMFSGRRNPNDNHFSRKR